MHQNTGWASLVTAFALVACGCASSHTISKEQHRLLLSQKRAVRDMLPTLHDEISNSSSVGALIVFKADGSASAPYIGDSPIAATRKWLEANPAPEREGLRDQAAVFVYASGVAVPTEWHSLQVLAQEVSKEDETRASLHALQEQAEHLAREGENFSVLSKKLREQVDRLEAFGVDITRVAVVQQSLLDGHQEQLIAFRSTLTELQLALRIQATSLTDGQRGMDDSLKTIISRLAAIEQQLERF